MVDVRRRPHLRDVAVGDEAVQDAFVKAYCPLASFREELPFEVWFTRILINGCLDRIKARTRRERWLVSAPEPSPGQSDFPDRVAGGGPVVVRPAGRLGRDRAGRTPCSMRQSTWHRGGGKSGLRGLVSVPEVVWVYE